MRLFKWISLVGRHQFLDQSYNTKPSVYWPRVTYLGDGVIDVHGRHGKFSGLWELIQTMYTSNALLHNPLDHVKHGGVALQHQVGGIPSIIQDLKDSSNTHEGKTCGQSINILQNHKKINYKVFIYYLFFAGILDIFHNCLIWKKPPKYRFFFIENDNFEHFFTLFT